jgi:hypothetical protein
MPLAMPDLELDLTVLEAYEFSIACGHSCHNIPAEAWWHAGDAYYWAKAWHRCSNTGPVAEPNLYALCKPSGDWFLARHNVEWHCIRCMRHDIGHRMVEVIGPINP